MKNKWLNISIVFSLLLLGGNLSAKDLVAVFDMNHKEIFSPSPQGKLRYTNFYQMFEAAGFRNRMNNQEITADSLKDVNTLVLYGPMVPLLGSELQAVEQFVKGGGNLLVQLHIAAPAMNLTEKFYILATNGIILDEANKLGQATDFYVPEIKAHPLTKDIKRLAVFGSWGLLSLQGAQTIAATSNKAWMEQNGNKTRDSFEEARSYGIVAINDKIGGKVVVIADDAPFLDNFIGEANNREFARNLILWFKGQ